MSERIELSAAPESVAAARRWTERRLHELGHADLTEPTTQVVSELVANVVLHARTACAVRIVEVGSRLRVEVTDHSDRMPGPVGNDPMAGSGRGLRMVERLTAASGSEAHPDGGKLIWAEIDLVPAP